MMVRKWRRRAPSVSFFSKFGAFSQKHFFEESHALSNVNFEFSSLEETRKVLVSVHPLCTVYVSEYETLIAAVLFNYRGLYRYRSRRKQRVNGLVSVPRGSQVRAFFCRVHYRICACKQEISSGTGTCF